MTYTRGVPQRDAKGQDSQPLMQENTNVLDNVFDIDHYGFSDTTNNRGKHKAVRFKDQTSEGDPTTASDEFALYNKEDADSNQELFYREPDNGDVNQLTKGSKLNTGVFPSVAVNFNNAGAIQSEVNVSSVTVLSTGKYKINFTNPLPNNNYSWSISGMGSTVPIRGMPILSIVYSATVNTNFLRVEFRNATDGTLVNINRGSVVIFEKT